MNKYPDFWSIMIGPGPIGYLLAYITISLICAFGMILILASDKYKSNPATPDKWSWRYFIADNLGKFLAGLFLLPITIRILYQYVDAAWMIPLSVGVGFGFLGLSKIATNYGVWTTKRLSKWVASKIDKEKPDVETPG